MGRTATQLHVRVMAAVEPPALRDMQRLENLCPPLGSLHLCDSLAVPGVVAKKKPPRDRLSQSGRESIWWRRGRGEDEEGTFVTRT